MFIFQSVSRYWSTLYTGRPCEKRGYRVCSESHNNLDVAGVKGDAPQTAPPQRVADAEERRPPWYRATDDVATEGRQSQPPFGGVRSFGSFRERPVAGDIDWPDKRISRSPQALREDHSAWRRPSDTGPFSLAQPKTALLLQERQMGVPSGRIPTTHILTPPAGAICGHAENERFCLALARAHGPPVASRNAACIGPQVGTSQKRNICQPNRFARCQANNALPRFIDHASSERLRLYLAAGQQLSRTCQPKAPEPHSGLPPPCTGQFTAVSRVTRTVAGQAGMRVASASATPRKPI